MGFLRVSCRCFRRKAQSDMIWMQSVMNGFFVGRRIHCDKGLVQSVVNGQGGEEGTVRQAGSSLVNGLCLLRKDPFRQELGDVYDIWLDAR